MNTFNRFYRKRRKSSPHESFDLAYSGLRERSHESGSDFPQLLDHENQFDGLPDAKDPEADSDINTSGKRTDSVFSYLSAIGPIRILSREEELGLAKGIAEGEAQIAAEALSSLFALRRILDVGKKVAAGLVDAREVIGEPADAVVNATINDKIIQSRFRNRMARLKYLARRYERTTEQRQSSMSAIKRRKLDRSLVRQRQK